MANIVKGLKQFKCSNCGLTYQSIFGYIHPVLGIVCLECMDVDVVDSRWA